MQVHFVVCVFAFCCERHFFFFFAILCNFSVFLCQAVFADVLSFACFAFGCTHGSPICSHAVAFPVMYWFMTQVFSFF